MDIEGILSIDSCLQQIFLEKDGSDNNELVVDGHLLNRVNVQFEIRTWRYFITCFTI